MTKFKYRIEETAGLTKAIGNFVVKSNGKAIRYFWDRGEAHDFVQAEMENAFVASIDGEGWRI